MLHQNISKFDFLQLQVPHPLRNQYQLSEPSNALTKSGERKYLFQRSLHHIPHNFDLLPLTQPQNPRDGLFLDRGVPLRFQHVDKTCHCQIEPCR